LKVTSASGAAPTAPSAPSWRARSARPGAVSDPVTYQPLARRASPIEPPTSPVPTTAARRGPGSFVGTASRAGSLVGPASRAGSAGEVISKPPRRLQVDVLDLLPLE